MIWCINPLLSGYLWARHGEGIVAAVDAWLSATGATVPHGWMVFMDFMDNPMKIPMGFRGTPHFR